MGCPVIHDDSGGDHQIQDMNVVAKIHQFEKQMLPNCTFPLKHFNECQTKVIQGEKENCLMESKCFLACDQAHNRIKKTVFSKCSTLLDYGVSVQKLERRYQACMQEETDAANKCKTKLEEFLSCARASMQETTVTNHG